MVSCFYFYWYVFINRNIITTTKSKKMKIWEDNLILVQICKFFHFSPWGLASSWSGHCLIWNYLLLRIMRTLVKRTHPVLWHWNVNSALRSLFLKCETLWFRNLSVLAFFEDQRENIHFFPFNYVFVSRCMFQKQFIPCLRN